MIDKEQILSLTQGGLNVYNHYLGFEVNTHKNFRSPFYDDKKPSCHIYYDSKSTSYKFHDHGEPSYSGDCFWFVGELYGLDTRRDFLDILKLIVQDLMLPIRVADDYPLRFGKRHIQRKRVRPKAIQEEERIDDKPYKIQTMSYSQPFLTFWGRFGVDENTLKRYNVINISQFESINSQGEAYTIKATGTEPIYGYKGYDYVKIYRPNSTKLRFLYGGRKPSLYCFGLDQIPTKGDVLLITGGEKDVLSLAAHGFNAICFNSETSVIPESLIDGLLLRFRHIVLLYDVDETGIRESERQKVALEKYKVRSIQLPLSGGQFEKDVSDFFSLGHTSEELRGLIATLLQEIYSETLMMMKSCEIDYDNPPDLSKAIVSVNHVPLGTQDNLFCITGGEGTGKSNFVSAILAGAMRYDALVPEETLGLEVNPNPYGLAVIHYDTEQSEAQLYKNLGKTLRRASLVQVPSFYHSLYLASLSRQDRLRLIRDSMDLLYHEHGGIHLVVIDGIADLIRSANDESESIAIVDELYRLAGIYNTCIICVLHFVPNGVKLRGHIGSELQRKAAGILSIEKDDNPELSVVKALKVRDGSPLDVPMMLFGWDKELDMFAYRGEKSKEEKEKRKTVDLASLAKEIMAGREVISYSELVDAVMEEMDVKDRTAKKYIAYMRDQDILSQENSGNYIKGKLCHTS